MEKERLKLLVLIVSAYSILIYNLNYLKTYLVLESMLYLFTLRALVTLRDRASLSTLQQMTFNAFKSFFVHIIFDSFLFEEVVLFNKEYVLGWARNELIAQTLVFITLKHFLKAEKLIRVREVAALIDVCFGVVVIILFRLVNNMAVSSNFSIQYIMLLQILCMQLMEPLGATIYDFLVLRQRRGFWLKFGLWLAPMSALLIAFYRFHDCRGHECELGSGAIIMGYSVLLTLLGNYLPVYS